MENKHIMIHVFGGTSYVQTFYLIPPDSIKEIDDCISNIRAQSEIISKNQNLPCYSAEYIPYSEMMDWYYQTFEENDLRVEMESISVAGFDYAIMQHSESRNIPNIDFVRQQPFYSVTETLVDTYCEDFNLSPINEVLVHRNPIIGHCYCICVVSEERPVFQYEFNIQKEYEPSLLEFIIEDLSNDYVGEHPIIANVLGYDSVLYQGKKIYTRNVSQNVVLVELDCHGNSKVIQTFPDKGLMKM